jgi:glycosyltransferase involved in cell wall biosynthesis
VIVAIPVRNEAESLPAVLSELRATRPDLPVLVIDDASTDATRSVVGPDTRYLRIDQHIGIGGAMRAGLRFASALGYDTVVRLDGDGQHPPEQIAALLEPIVTGRADAVLGSRYITDDRERSRSIRRLVQYLLAACMTRVIGQPITDATSGAWAFGPAAVALLAEHHPTGYPEPELLLFLRRNALRIVEVPVSMRSRLAGRSSLNWARGSLAGARVLMAMLIVPLRRIVKVGSR